MTTTFAPASDKQISYLNSLLANRVIANDLRDDLCARISDGTLDSKRASNAIDTLLSCPKASTTSFTAKVVALELGMYRTSDGTMYRVHESRETGNRYAKRMEYDLFSDKPRFVYAKGAISTLTPEDRMSLADAKAWGMETGFCCVCGAFLTDEKSVANGIGPVCAKYF
jgi:hypothetical protein